MGEPDELARIAAEYVVRDARASEQSRSPWRDPAYVHYMHQLDVGLLAAIDAAGIQIEGSSVLDLGCGSGYFLNRLGEFGATRLCGIDLARNRIAAASARYPTLDLSAGSATALPFGDREFDLVTQFTCFSSVLESAVRREMSAEAVRVLRPGGVFLSYDLAPVARPVKVAAQAIRRAASAPATPTRPVSLGELRSLFPGQVLYAKAPSLDLDLSRRLGGASWAVACLQRVRILRTHLLVAIRC